MKSNETLVIKSGDYLYARWPLLELQSKINSSGCDGKEVQIFLLEHVVRFSKRRVEERRDYMIHLSDGTTIQYSSADPKTEADFYMFIDLLSKRDPDLFLILVR
jgi:hypothetical protein